MWFRITEKTGNNKRKFWEVKAISAPLCQFKNNSPPESVCPLEKKNQTKQKVKLKKHKHAHWVSSIQNKFGVSHPSCKCQTTACLHKEQFPWIERQSSLASVRQWREQQFSWSQIIKVKHFCNNQRNYGLTLFQEWNEALLYQEKRSNFGLHWVTHTM